MITLHVKCFNEDDKSESLREMGLDVPEKTEFRRLRIKPEFVMGFYENADIGCFLMITNQEELTVSETFEELEKLLQ